MTTGAPYPTVEKCDVCGEPCGEVTKGTAEPPPSDIYMYTPFEGSVRVQLHRVQSKRVQLCESRWCPKCAVVLWDQMAELSTFHEKKEKPPVSGLLIDILLDSVTR